MPPVQLTIPQPCAESWAAMTPAAHGRYCAACQKTVIDFTQLADAEVLAHLARAAAGSTCGRFRPAQLNRPLQPVAVAAPSRWRAWLAAAVALWGARELAGSGAQAQARTEQVPVAPTPLEQLQRKPDYEGVAPAVVLRGSVHEKGIETGLPGASVVIQGSQVGVATDMNGQFSLDVPAALVADGLITIEVHLLGYDTEVRRVAIAGKEQTLQVALQVNLHSSLSGEVSVVYTGRKMPPAPWHPRRFYHWGKYWLTRPFK